MIGAAGLSTFVQGVHLCKRATSLQWPSNSRDAHFRITYRFGPTQSWTNFIIHSGVNVVGVSFLPFSWWTPTVTRQRARSSESSPCHVDVSKCNRGHYYRIPDSFSAHCPMWLLSGVWSLLNQKEPQNWCLEVTYDNVTLSDGAAQRNPTFCSSGCSDIIDYICTDASCELQDWELSQVSALWTWEASKYDYYYKAVIPSLPPCTSV